MISSCLSDHLFFDVDSFVRRKKKTESCVKQNYSKEQANGVLQSMMKILYTRLFDLTVAALNQSLEMDHDMRSEEFRHIGILDIYGFEELQVRLVNHNAHVTVQFSKVGIPPFSNAHDK